jgi:hypothetical protein
LAASAMTKRCHPGFEMRRVAFICLTTLSLSLGSALADDQTATPTTAVTPAPTVQVASTAPADMDEVVCRRMKVTGQLLPGPKVCRTRGQWVDMQKQSQYDVEQAQNVSGAHGSK